MARVLIWARGDQDRLADLRREVDIAERKAQAEQAGSPLRVGDEAPAKVPAYVQAAKDAFDAAVDEATERAEEWLLEPIGHEEWRELLKAHPARKVTGEDGKETTHPDDQGFEVNTETFPKALLTYTDPEDPEIRTVTAPEFETDAALRRRLKRLSGGEFDSLWLTAYQANTGAPVDPKLLRFSPTPRSSET